MYLPTLAVEDLARDLLAHIEHAYPTGGFLYTTPDFEAPPPPKKVAPKRIPPVSEPEPSALPEVRSKLSKILPGIDLHTITPTPILLIHAGEETSLLDRLARALSQKKAPAQVILASALTPSLLKSPLVKLLVLTPKAQEDLTPLTTRAKTYTMEPPATYLASPHLRHPLSDALCALL